MLWVAGFAMVALPFHAVPGEDPSQPQPFQLAITADSIAWDDSKGFPKEDFVDGRNSREETVLWALGLADTVRFSGSQAWHADCIRLVLNQPTKVGTILLGAAAQVATLKPKVELPGDVGSDEQWDVLTPNSPQGGACIYTLPAKTKIRALRIKGDVNTLRLISGRYIDIAPLADTLASYGNSKGLTKGQPWNVNSSVDISPDAPQWLIFSWKKSQDIQALWLISPFFKQFAVHTFKGGETEDYSETKETDWQPQRTAESMGVPFRYVQTSMVNFGKTVSTAAVRMRILQPWLDENEDIKAVTGVSSRVASLRGFVILKDIGDAPYPLSEK